MRPRGMLFAMGENFGAVKRRHGKGRSGYVIDLGTSVEPRYLTSGLGARFETAAHAESVLGAIRTCINSGEEPQTVVDRFAPLSRRNAIAPAIAEYLADATARLAPGTVDELRREFGPTGMIGRHWGSRRLGDLRAPLLRAWSAALLAEGKGPKTVQNAVGYLHAFAGWLWRDERIAALPPFPRVRVPEHAPTIISPRSQQLILAGIPWERRGAFLAAVACGLRPGEIRALNRDAEREVGGCPGLDVRAAMKGPNADALRGTTKTGDASWVPILDGEAGDELLRWLAWRREQTDGRWRSPALFVNPTARGSLSEMRAARERARTRCGSGPQALSSGASEYRWTGTVFRAEWKRAAAKVGLGHVKQYDSCKHSSATAWLADGVSERAIQRMLRHRDLRSTRRYAQLTDGGILEAFARRRGGSRDG